MSLVTVTERFQHFIFKGSRLVDLIIENTCHWSLDVTYSEDTLRTRHL